MSSRHATPDHPIHELLARRHSPYAFDRRPVAPAELRALFEAARWAASSYNEQPWRFVAAGREEGETFARILSCLVEANQEWAQHAGALALGIVSRRFARNDRPNKAAEHDLGLAAASLTFEATQRGLFVHQMIGIEPERARAAFGIPEGYEAFTGLAIGHAGRFEGLPEKFVTRDQGARTRRPLAEFVFGASFGAPAAFLTES